MPDSFEAKVNQQIACLQSSPLPAIEAEVARKRRAWFDLAERSKLKNQPGLSPRRAYELLFFDYMGLSSEDLPVLEETPNEIVWRSQNPCPTLEACRRLGLDTRQVCRGAYEKSTQAFLSQLDPQLRFLRSYVEIRPYTPHCLERILRVNFNEFMALALQQAQLSQQASCTPNGAVIVRGNQILAQAQDTPVQHAPASVIRHAVTAANDPDLCGCILFSTVEPCPTCLSMAMEANLTTVVYGVPSSTGCEVPSLTGCAVPDSNEPEIAHPSPILLEIIGGILADECRSLFFNQY